MKRHTVIQLITFILIVGLLAALYKFVIVPHISLDRVREHERVLGYFIESHYWLSVVLFMAFYALIVFFMLPITLVLNIAAGYFYGVVPATIMCVMSASCGALCSMLSFRYLLNGLAERLYGNKIDGFRNNFKTNGISYLIALQLLPVTPYPLITASAALSGMSAQLFFGATFIGIIPGTIIYTIAGKSFATIKEADSLMSWPLIILLCLLSLLALLPSIVRYYIQKRRNH